MFGSNKDLLNRISDLKEQNKFLKDMVKDLQSQVFILMNKSNEYIQSKNINRIEETSEKEVILNKEYSEMQEALKDISQDLIDG